MDAQLSRETDILPPSIRKRFNAYPNKGQTLQPQLKDDGKGSRKSYGLKLYQITGQVAEFATCAYCGLSFIDEPAHWFLVSVDHIVPKNKKIQDFFGLNNDYIDAMANQVLCCQGCNGRANKDELRDIAYNPPSVWTPDAFFALRDQIFLYRSQKIAILKREELEEFYVLKWGGKGISSTS